MSLVTIVTMHRRYDKIFFKKKFLQGIISRKSDQFQFFTPVDPNKTGDLKITLHITQKPSDISEKYTFSDSL